MNQDVTNIAIGYSSGNYHVEGEWLQKEEAFLYGGPYTAKILPGNSITITGGTDVTNTRLISWLEANATQVIEELPSSKETYFSIMSELAQTIAEKTGAELPLSIDEMIDALDGSNND